MTVSGACLCGAVRWALDGPFQSLTHCHCSMCRKHSGALFATLLAAPLERFRWTGGKHEIRTYRASAFGDRVFCATCGSSLPVELPGFGLAVSPAGGLTGDLGLWPQSHMFTASKAPWHEITDALPQYPAFRPSVDLPGLPQPSVHPEPGLILGSCLCGGAAFEVDAQAVVLARNCHCSRCRRHTGAAHASNLFVAMDAVRFRRGEGLRVIWKLPQADRFASAFCRSCGGVMPRPIAALDRYLIPMGSLDTDPGMAPSCHIFTADKAPWFEITDGLPQHESYAP